MLMLEAAECNFDASAPGADLPSQTESKTFRRFPARPIQRLAVCIRCDRKLNGASAINNSAQEDFTVAAELPREVYSCAEQTAGF